MADQIQRGWMPYRTAASQYIGIDSDLLLGAIKRKELKAYEKPRRTDPDHTKREYHCYFVCKEDVDAWIRTYWQEAYATA